MKNAVVAQSGGPSSVINASLQGVIEACADYEGIGTVFGAFHGVEGILLEELVDLGAEDPTEISLLRQTPASGAIGTCRYKLNETNSEDFERIIEVFRAHNIGYFFYIGGNDSMDTASKVAALAEQRGFELTVVGVPKTIDNDVGDDEFTLVDHTPGYGSTARYWASIIKNLNEDNRAMSPSEPVAVVQAMGRSAGFIPAAARLADPKREIPMQIYLAESDHTLDSMVDHVSDELRRSGRCVVVVGEGFPVGSLGERHDAFGHIEYAASETTVAQVVVNQLNRVGLPVRGYATKQVPGALQRSTSCDLSTRDVEEAYQVGRHAVSLAARGTGGVMATIRRVGGVPWARKGVSAPATNHDATYRAVYEEVPLATVANFHRQLPPHWLSEDQLDVTDHFVRYARPLIGEERFEPVSDGGLQRFTRFRCELVEAELPPYVPQNLRG